MISLILPYWNRQAAADKALALIAKHYDGIDLEVVVVDDGDPRPFQRPPIAPKNLLVLRLPEKREPFSPVTSWNHGVAKASGDIIVLSCIEILHENPVIEQMAEEVRRLGPHGYVVAAAWCPEQRAWHCHSSIRVPDCPPGVGIGFCSALHRSLYLEVGGFEEIYRGGAGYEDRDFIRKMLKFGARFSMRDDLVVIHPKTDATIKWGAEKLERNQKIYQSRWAC